MLFLLFHCSLQLADGCEGDALIFLPGDPVSRLHIIWPILLNLA